MLYTNGRHPTKYESGSHRKAKRTLDVFLRCCCNIEWVPLETIWLVANTTVQAKGRKHDLFASIGDLKHLFPGIESRANANGSMELRNKYFEPDMAGMSLADISLLLARLARDRAYLPRCIKAVEAFVATTRQRVADAQRDADDAERALHLFLEQQAAVEARIEAITAVKREGRSAPVASKSSPYVGITAAVLEFVGSAKGEWVPTNVIVNNIVATLDLPAQTTEERRKSAEYVRSTLKHQLKKNRVECSEPETPLGVKYWRTPVHGAKSKGHTPPRRVSA